MTENDEVTISKHFNQIVPSGETVPDTFSIPDFPNFYLRLTLIFFAGLSEINKKTHFNSQNLHIVFQLLFF